MQNENAGKTVEQIAAELNPYRPEADRYEGWEQGFITGTEHAQQSQPMWREIEAKVRYYNVMVRLGNDTEMYHESTGRSLLAIGYTHYLTSEDLLKLPIEKK